MFNKEILKCEQFLANLRDRAVKIAIDEFILNLFEYRNVIGMNAKSTECSRELLRPLGVFVDFGKLA